MKAVLASKNPHKLAEIQAILSGLGVEVVMESELGLDIDVDETGTTFEENSRLKAEAVMRAANMPAIADDSGLMVDALDGAPGEDYIEPTYAIENANRFDDEALGSDAPGLLSVYDADENGVVLRYYRDDGTPIESLTMHGEKWYRQVALRGGLIEVLDLNTAAYYDLETMNCVFETYLGYEAD